jgi:hypothetical protein
MIWHIAQSQKDERPGRYLKGLYKLLKKFPRLSWPDRELVVELSAPGNSWEAGQVVSGPLRFLPLLALSFSVFR